jgi:shikimate dehydrogenase
MTPNVEGLPWPEGLPFQPGQVVYDLVYNPPQTRLLQKAAADGATAIGGLGMLIWQGAISFELWTGQRPPVDKMRRAALVDLRRRGVLPRNVLPSRVQVRPAISADAEAIAALHTEVHHLHASAVPHFFQPASGETLPLPTLHEWMASPDKQVWVADVGDELVGYLILDIRRRPATPATQPFDVVYIDQIAVKRTAQQQGIGERLITAAKDVARQQQIHTITLNVWTFNDKAQRFFAQQGFVPFNHRLWLTVD